MTRTRRQRHLLEYRADAEIHSLRKGEPLIMTRSVLVRIALPPLTEARRASLLSSKHFGAPSSIHGQSLLLAVWHLLLLSIIVLAIVVWLTLALWIVVRLVRTADKGEPPT